MKVHRFFGGFDLSASRLLIRDKDFVHQVKTVLKMSVGESIMLCDGTGREAEATIVEVAKQGIDVMMNPFRKNVNESHRYVVLYAALLKREKFEWVVQKATEMGVKEIVPLVTRRTIKLQSKLPRLREIAKEAAELSERGMIPVIQEALDFSDSLQAAKNNQRNILFDREGNMLTRREGDREERVGIWIGPEGGWEGEELEEAKRAQIQIASLGPLVLRGETASTIASYLAVRGFCL